MIRMSNKPILGLAAAFLLATAATAGFVGEGPPLQKVTVKNAQTLHDDTELVLEGYLVKQLGHETYLFRDKTGTLEVEIDDKDFRGLNVSPQDRIRIYGEVDHERHGIVVDADRIERID